MHTHTYTLKVNGVLAGPVGGWGDFFFFLSLFVSFFFFNLFISCLFLVNWGTLGIGVGEGCSTSTAPLRALAHHCISDDAVDIYRVRISHWSSLGTEAATQEWCQEKKIKSKNLKNVNLFAFICVLFNFNWDTKYSQQVEGFHTREIRRTNISGNLMGFCRCSVKSSVKPVNVGSYDVVTSQLLCI